MALTRLPGRPSLVERCWKRNDVRGLNGVVGKCFESCAAQGAPATGSPARQSSMMAAMSSTPARWAINVFLTARFGVASGCAHHSTFAAGFTHHVQRAQQMLKAFLTCGGRCCDRVILGASAP